MKQLMILIFFVLAVTYSCKKDAFSSKPEEPVSVGFFKKELCPENPSLNSFISNPLGGGSTSPMYTLTPKMKYGTNGAPCIWLQFMADSVIDDAWTNYYNGGNSWVTETSGFNEEKVDSIVRMVAYALYDGTHYPGETIRHKVNITTSKADFDATTSFFKQKIIITGSRPSWFNGYAGVAWRNSFYYTTEVVPCFVFKNPLYGIASWISMSVVHEMGHTIGLPHQADYDGSCNKTNEYSPKKIMGGKWWTDTAWFWHNGAAAPCFPINDFDTLKKAFPWAGSGSGSGGGISLDTIP